MKTIIKNIKQNKWFIIVALIVGIGIGYVFNSPSDQHINSSDEESTHQHVDESAHQIWTCSMHPQIRMDHPGKCPICSMDLIPLEQDNTSEENMDPNEIKMTESAIKLADIQTMEVKKDYSKKEVYLLGKVKPDERNIAELTARFGGRIEKLFVNFTGQNVKKGEKLATIYSPELVTAQKELLEAVAYKKTNPSLYQASRNKLKLWDLTEAQIDGIEKEGKPQNYFNVLSPISGTVTVRHVALGDYVKEGNALFQVIDLHRVWIMFEAYESDLAWLNTGDDVKFTVQSLPGENFQGKVTYIDPFLDAKTRVAHVRVEVSNPKLELKPEMFANGIIIPTISNNQKDILIPKTAVLWTGKRSVVYVKVPDREQTTFLYRQIVLGPDAGDFYVVKEGLNEGEEIAVNGVFKIDAAAQLEGKTSMMNPDSGASSTEHMNMDMGTDKAKTKDMNMDMPDENNASAMKANVEHATFRVSGNCEMCKAAIEKAVNALDGVNMSDWNIETKQMHVSFNKDKVSLDVIHKAIAAAGYDTDKEKASEEAYNKLPSCCQYTR